MKGSGVSRRNGEGPPLSPMSTANTRAKAGGSSNTFSKESECDDVAVWRKRKKPDHALESAEGRKSVLSCRHRALFPLQLSEIDESIDSSGGDCCRGGTPG